MGIWEGVCVGAKLGTWVGRGRGKLVGWGAGT